MPNYRIITEGPLETFVKKLEKEGRKSSSGKTPTQLIKSADRFCREHAGLSEEDGAAFYQCKMGMIKKWVGLKTSGVTAKKKNKNEEFTFPGSQAKELIGSVTSGLDPVEVLDAYGRPFKNDR